MTHTADHTNEAYRDGYDAGRGDRFLNDRSEVAWAGISSLNPYTQAYAQGYRQGWLSVEHDAYDVARDDRIAGLEI